MSKTTHPKSEDVSSNVLDAANSLIETITELVGPAPLLSATDVRRSAKPRQGSDKVVATIAALSDQYGLTLPLISTATIVAKQKQAQDLIPVQKKLVAALKQVSDVIFAASSESWGGTTMHYTVLKRLAKANGELEENLAPIREFFAQRSAEVVQGEKEQTATRKVARASKTMAKANAELAALQGAPAPVSQPVAAKATTTAAPSPAAAPATPVSTSPATV